MPPHHHRALLPLFALAVAAAVTVAGCSSSSSSPESGPSSRATGHRGGTLHVLAGPGAVSHLDPQQMRTQAEADVGRLLYRGLTAFPTTTGPANRHAVPDLASGPGQPSDHARTWTFTLQPGLTFQDGSAITATDVRRGVERSYLKEFGGPPAYLTDVLDCGAGYAGPQSGACPAVSTPDARTVVFHLRKPVGDFPDVVARPAFVPVPSNDDDLDRHPDASGPYSVSAYDPGRQLTLERNSAWDPKTDAVRPALPDTIDIALGEDTDDVVRRIAADQDDDASAVPLGIALPVAEAGLLAQDAGARDRLDHGYDSEVDAVAFDTRAAPLDNVAVRTALVYALSRAGYRTAEGGAAAGTLATTLLSPAIAAYRPFDLWQAPAAGDPARASKALTAAGYPNGFTVTLDTGGDAAGGQAISDALARAGVTTKPAPTGKGAAPAAITLVRWMPDRPAAQAVLRPLLCSCGDHDVAHYSSDDVDHRIAAATEQTSPADADQAWAQVDMRALQDVPMVPLLHRQVTRLHGSKVANTWLAPAYGAEYDLAALSVS